MDSIFDKKFNVELSKKRDYVNLYIRLDSDKVEVFKVKVSDMAELIASYNKAMNSA